MLEEKSLQSNCSLDEAITRDWDAIVIGCGPAGSLAAQQLALANRSVLLVDKASFPRRKVCGCYLNGSALATLRAVGLDRLTQHLSAPSVSRVRIGTRGRTAELSLPPGAAISRFALDSYLIEGAIDSGAKWLDQTTARVGDCERAGRQVTLRRGDRSELVTGKVVVVADGVAGHSLRECDDVTYQLAPQSLIGSAAITPNLPDGYVSGTIQMAIGQAGYVGALQLENGLLDVAAAFAPGSLKEHSPGQLAQSIVDQSGLPTVSGLTELKWQGTPPLTRAPNKPAAERLYLIGDAAGYVEPFTGEGISWALASARLVAPIAVQDIQQHSLEFSDRWTRLHHRMLRPRQRVCRWITSGLRNPWLVGASVIGLSALPSLARPVVHWLNRAPGLKNECLHA